MIQDEKSYSHVEWGSHWFRVKLSCRYCSENFGCWSVCSRLVHLVF
jgi:hypothetical protein